MSTNLPAQKPDQEPNALEVATGALDIMQFDALRKRLETSKPDILIRPHIESVDLFDFHKIEYVLETGEIAAQTLGENLQTLTLLKIRKPLNYFVLLKFGPASKLQPAPAPDQSSGLASKVGPHHPPGAVQAHP